MTARPLISTPASVCIADVTMYIDRVVARTRSPYSLIEQTYKWPGEQWRIDFSLASITRKDIAGQWKAFGTALEGGFGIFLIGDPSARIPVGVATGTPVVDGVAVQGANTLPTRGWTPNITGIMRAGDMLQTGTGTGSRLYMVMEDANSDAFGKAVLKLSPALRNAPINGAPIVVNDAKGAFCLSAKTFSWNVRPGPVYSIQFQAEEVVGA